MKDVLGEFNVPLFIAKEGVKLAKCRVISLVAPSKFSIL